GSPITMLVSVTPGAIALCRAGRMVRTGCDSGAGLSFLVHPTPQTRNANVAAPKKIDNAFSARTSFSMLTPTHHVRQVVFGATYEWARDQWPKRPLFPDICAFEWDKLSQLAGDRFTIGSHWKD